METGEAEEFEELGYLSVGHGDVAQSVENFQGSADPVSLFDNGVRVREELACPDAGISGR
jgi:hypothetical protein